jgi:hypothetical protein
MNTPYSCKPIFSNSIFRLFRKTHIPDTERKMNVENMSIYFASVNKFQPFSCRIIQKLNLLRFRFRYLPFYRVRNENTMVRNPCGTKSGRLVTGTVPVTVKLVSYPRPRASPAAPSGFSPSHTSGRARKLASHRCGTSPRGISRLGESPEYARSVQRSIRIGAISDP